MFAEVFDLAVSNGLWAALFVALFIYVLKDTSNREKKYQITISSLSSHLGVVNEIKDNIDEIDLKIKSKVKKGTKIDEQTKEQTI